jgi:uncharacterized membrane protein
VNTAAPRRREAELSAFESIFIITAVVFLIGRITLLFIRDPFFDELFTVWISRRSVPSILHLLTLDSGPPVFYFFVKTLSFAFGSSVTVARLVSLAAAVVSLVVVATSAIDRSIRLRALAILSLLPAHLMFSTEARAYALCSLFAGSACILLVSWSSTGRRWTLVTATLLLVAAAYTHYYGVLFFPVPVVLMLLFRRSAAAFRDATLATFAAACAFAPGFWLAFHQPRAAMTWLTSVVTSPLSSSLTWPLVQLGFAAPFPAVYAPPSPWFLTTLSVVCVLFASAMAVVRSDIGRRFLATILVPMAAMMVLAFGGMYVYFPMRFETVLAIPVACFLAAGLAATPRTLSSVLFATMVALSLFFAVVTIHYHGTRPPDPFQNMAGFIRAKVPETIPVVASGPMYLELLVSREQPGTLIALPSRDAAHPGWHEPRPDAEIRRELLTITARAPHFVWTGPAGSPEFSAIRSLPGARPLFRDRGLYAILVSTQR